ncbi:corticotropin-releasing factor-binding protein [Eurytemora carolleeae]|uniref:corticotropin-releasing factor-binding protein n=1 Tax=Eurytemora carolleeae TaxID=1294199 RepID=UPI000C76C77F|nr:corticotropin-releasing factor-binding protein [Eurytemora carolleeae]|eukprot:XP_023337529.1 corticotropin-releasing factor-binding protein-like [Eurytemora affinis]
MGKQLFLLFLHITCSLSIFHRWYTPYSKIYPERAGQPLQDRRHAELKSRKVEKRNFVEKELEERNLEDCMTVSHSESGIFSYSSSFPSEVCGLYLVGRPNQKIVVTLQTAELSGECDQDIVVLVDGWELNGHVVPSDQDHSLPISERFVEVCQNSNQPVQIVSSQNAAMVQFKISSPESKFTVSVEYIDNPDPCNVLMSEMTGVFKISNQGEERNCSVTTLLFPAKVKLLEVNVGSRFKKRSVRRSRRGFNGIIPRCSEMGEKDFLELGGAEDLSSNLETKSTLCGFQPKPSIKDLTILCGSSTVRLVSSGEYRNSVTALVQAATEDDLDITKNIIMTCPKFEL